MSVLDSKYGALWLRRQRESSHPVLLYQDGMLKESWGFMTFAYIVINLQFMSNIFFLDRTIRFFPVFRELLLVHSHCIIHIRAKILNQPSVHVRVGRETEEYSYNKTLYHFKSKFFYLRLEIILNKPGTKGKVPHDLTYMRNSKPFNSEWYSV